MALRILLSNDDGVHAAGLRSLRERLAREHTVTVVAPTEERSTTGHSLSLDRPLRLEAVGERIWGCTGFPADCILMGLGHVCKQERPEMVVTGINRGANLGQDLFYSGTVAAAREAAFHGVPALATSLVFKDFTNPQPAYASAAEIAAWLVEAGVHRLIPPQSLLNLNVPDMPLNQIKGLRFTQVGLRRYSEEVHMREDARGRKYFWLAGLYLGHEPIADSDCQALYEGYAALTPNGLINQAYDWEPLRRLTEKLHAERFPVV